MEEGKIVELVRVPEWKSMLYELVDKGEIDPWNVDIVRLTSIFIEEIRQMKSKDLYIPANVVLAASILLYLKSSILREEKEERDTEVVEDIVLPEPEDVPPPTEEVVAPLRLTRRKVSLEELMNVMEKLMKKTPKKEPYKPPEVEEVFALPDEGEEVDLYIEEVYRKVRNAEVVYLRELYNDTEEFVRVLLALLYLATEGKVELIQEEIFGEVLVKVVS